jgi:hypothetical protein
MDNSLVLLGVGAVAGATTTVVKEATKLTADIVRALVMPSAQALGEGAGAEFKRFFEARAERALTVVAKTSQLLTDGKVTPSAVPPRLLSMTLIAAADEDNPDMQRLWATLLANSADPEQQKNMMPAFVSILQNLSPIEARVLELVYQESLDERPRIGYNPGEDVRGDRMTLVGGDDPSANIELTIGSDDLRVMTDNLGRLGLLEVTYSGATRFDMSSFDKDYGTLTLSPLGRRFVQACTVPPGAKQQAEA